MSNIDYTLQEWIKRILILITITVLIVLVYATDYYKGNKIDNIEKTIQNHTHYIDKLEADVDNLKEVQSYVKQRRNRKSLGGN